MELYSSKIKKRLLLLYNHNLNIFSLKDFLYFFTEKNCSENISDNNSLALKT